ncbi:hypothetical protein [Flavobacterium sp. KACC 22761]|uniref:hypothetical protein n=1 Tax=Flavobacterium sp. KACC 22761 TaxID=3092665 RepID=UPI002A7493D1|nr:hypothetical protein [Flavobacterium sp. KACC 22761]WPO79916.1 hypothetical protein SCB73_05940 [Flavobacterium sp. KACC 22761]
MEKQKFDQLVYVSKRPFWHFLIALPLYYFAISMLFKTLDLFYLGKIMDALKFVLATFFMFVCAGGLTFTKRVYADAEKKTVSFNFTLFKIPLCKNSVFENVQYISVYKNYADRDFEIYLWLSETKKKSISVHLDLNSALSYALKIANGLQVDLLDATEKGNFKWIEKKNKIN